MALFACLLCAACVSSGPTRGRPALLLENARLIDGSGRCIEGLDTVLVSGGKIVSLSAGRPAELPAGARKIDCRGKTVMPGFINTHVHDAYDRVQLARWARAGVTTVRDLGPHEEDYLERFPALDKDDALSSIVMSPPILRVEGGYGWSRPIADAADARAYVNELIDEGIQTVKFALEEDLPPGKRRTVMPQDIARAIVEAAHERGKRASVHVSRDQYARMAIEVGADEIAHLPIDELSEETIQASLAAGVIWIPTLELWRKVGMGYMPMRNLRRLREAGAKIAFGTDFGGYEVYFDRDFPISEAKLMAECGFSPSEIIASGTGIAAIACGLSGEIGDIAPGCRADLLVLDSDPLVDLTALERPRMVIHKGAVVAPR